MHPRHLIVPAGALLLLGGCDLLASGLRSAADSLDEGAGTPVTLGSQGEVKEESPEGFFRTVGNGGLPQPVAPLSAADCSTISNGGPTDGCLTAEIRCGETIVGHTVGGARVFDTQFYVDKFCTPNTTDHDGGDERIYRLSMPDGDWRAVVTLDTPCADLDVGAMTWQHDTCPGPGAMISRCEMFPKKGTKREQIELVSQRPTNWLIVVEGKDQQEGAFGLSVQCFPGLY